MEIKLNVVEPNLIVSGDGIYLGLDGKDIVPVGLDVDWIVMNHIGELKVSKGDLETIGGGKGKQNGEFDTPLNEYLQEFKARFNSDFCFSITDDSTRLFGLSYVVNAATHELPWEAFFWKELAGIIANPDGFNRNCDNNEKKLKYIRIDRKRTFEEIKKLHDELEPKTPDNFAGISILPGRFPYDDKTLVVKYLAHVTLGQLKAKDRTQLELAKSKLVEKLKKVKGPALSLDAPCLQQQIWRLYFDAPRLVRDYGDVLNSFPRFFKLDP